MYEILEKEDCIWWRRPGETESLLCLGPCEDREAIEDAMASFLEEGLAEQHLTAHSVAQ